jgi:hypothetical protein
MTQREGLAWCSDEATPLASRSAITATVAKTLSPVVSQAAPAASLRGVSGIEEQARGLWPGRDSCRRLSTVGRGRPRNSSQPPLTA